jgi:hypothetical protein
MSHRRSATIALLHSARAVKPDLFSLATRRQDQALLNLVDDLVLSIDLVDRSLGRVGQPAVRGAGVAPARWLLAASLALYPVYEALAESPSERWRAAELQRRRGPWQLAIEDAIQAFGVTPAWGEDADGLLAACRAAARGERAPAEEVADGE